MARIIRANGEVETIKPKNGKDFQLEELQSIVGGYIEIINLDATNRLMVVDEEGKLKNKPYNELATTIIRSETLLLDVVVGDVLVCSNKQIK